TDAEPCGSTDAVSCRSLASRHPGARSGGTSPEPPGAAAGALNSARLFPSRRVMKPGTARSLRSLLQSVVRSGTGQAAFLGGEEGGKTGTTNGGRDLLFIGFEPGRHWVIGVWLGNDDNHPSRATSALAASLWADIVRSSSPSR
ncbi:MAG: penicillin-binding transpeptidase domain-containing protein, partial [Cyanobium sp.]